MHSRTHTSYIMYYFCGWPAMTPANWLLLSTKPNTVSSQCCSPQPPTPSL